MAWRWLPSSGVASVGAPLIDGDHIYVASGGRVYCVDRVTGNKIWQFPPEAPIPGAFRTTPILSNGVLVGLGDNKIAYGIDPGSGEEKWSFVMPNRSIYQPVEADKFVVIEESDNSLIAIDPTTGKSVWNSQDTQDIAPYRISDGLMGQIGAMGSTVFYFTNTFQMHAISAVSEKELWTLPVRFSQLSSAARPIVYAGTIYVTSGPYLVAVNPATGTALWQTNTGFGTISYNPAPSPAGIFVISDEGQVMVYDESNGHPATIMSQPATITSAPAASPTAVGSKLIIPTTSGAIDLFDPVTQSVIWSYIVRPINEGPATPAQNQAGGRGQGPGAARQQGSQTSTSKEPVTEVVASGSAVLDGTTLIVPEMDTSLIAFDSTLGVDLTPPKVEMLFPNAGDQVSGQPPLLLYFKARDWGSGINEKTLKVTIDGKPYDYTFKHDGRLWVTFSNETKNRPLSDGRHDILVDVSDWMNNVAHQHFSITIDNTLPPIVLPGTPANNNGRPGNGPGSGGGTGGGGGDGGL